MSMENNSTIEQSRNTPKGDAQSVPKGWVETTLGEVVKIYSGKTRPKENGIYPIYGGNGILNYGNKYNQENDTIIIGRVGAYCGNIFSEKNKFWLSDNALGVKNNSKSDVSYLYYKLIYLKLNNHSIGGAQPLLTQGLLKKLEITIPKSISEQKAIAQILTAFDDKIELLQAQNKTLETTAQTIFKEWFGKYQIGDELPEGWRVGKIGTVVKIKQGKYVGSEKISEVKTGQYKFPVFGGGGIRGYLSDYIYETPQVILTCRGNGCGRIQLSENYSTVTNSCMALEDENFILNYKYIYLLTKTIDFESVTSGSAQPQITVTNLEGMEVIIPKESKLVKFNEIVKPLFRKLSINKIQIQALKKTRDTLLPKLMSGQLRVDEFKEGAI